MYFIKRIEHFIVLSGVEFYPSMMPLLPESGTVFSRKVGRWSGIDLILYFQCNPVPEEILLPLVDRLGSYFSDLWT